MAPNEPIRIGEISLTFEPPDTAVVEVIGAVDGAIVEEFFERLVTWAQDKPYLLVIFDVRRLTSLSSDGRKALISNGHRLPPRVLSIFGGSFTIKVVLDLMDRASWLLGSRNRQVRHWPDEDAARAWAAEMRNVFLRNAHAQAKPI